MAGTRETIMSALLAQCAKASTFATVSRQIDFDPAQGPTPMAGTPPAQPALYLLEDYEHHERPGGYGNPVKRTLNVMLWVWCKTPTGPTPGIPLDGALGATAINTLIEAIEAVFTPDDRNRGVYTIGGLVARSWIEGNIVKVTGDLNPDGQCFAAIPVSILIP